MSKFNFYILFLTFASAFLMQSCDNGGKKYIDTPTSGSIEIAVDDSYTSIIDAQIETFESLYPKAKINAHYLQEGDALKLFMNDSARIIVMNRELNEVEKSEFEARNLKPRITKIAYDGIAIIVHPKNQDTLLSMQQLSEIFSGKKKSWTALNSKSQLGDISIILDNKESSNGRLLREKFLQNKSFPKNCYAAKSNEEVINYVNKHPNAIGVIGANFISDKDDTLALSFLKKVNVVALCEGNCSDEKNYYKPYQAYVKLKQYPLYRNVYIISREARAGLGSGFTAFVAGDKGQRIILKSGLVPATSPIRIIEISN